MTHPQLFEHGYALLIGVDDNNVARLRLPGVAKDIAAFAEVLTHVERCAYPQDQIKVIRGEEATRIGILSGLGWLQEQIQQDKNATAIIYYSGHGHCDAKMQPPEYYLLPYDTVLEQLRLSSLPAKDFAHEIERIQPQRLLVVLDCCHAAGIEAKSVGEGPLTSAAIPSTLFASDEDLESGSAGDEFSKGLGELAAGRGRAVLSSSQGNQKSYMRLDGKMSVFTYHLIEALTGHAHPPEGATEVLVSDAVGHVHRQVPQTVAQMRCEQNPEIQLNGNFPAALLIGGKGLAKGELAPDPLEIEAAQPVQNTITNTGSGAIATDGGVAAGERGVAAGGNIDNSTILTGDGNQVRQVDTSGGAYDEGDHVEVGNMTGSTGVAIGSGASSTVNQGASNSDPAPQANSFCTQCGTKVSPDANFCGNCGAKI